MRNILIVVDMQNDFIDGDLGTAEAVAIVPNVVDKIRAYDPADIYVTLDTHQPDYLATQEGRNLPVEHCIRGTAGWQLRDEIAAALGINPELLINMQSRYNMSIAKQKKTLLAKLSDIRKACAAVF